MNRRAHRIGRASATGTAVLLLSAGLVLAPERVRSQEPPPELVTDRPDRTESAATVPPGLAQLESGVLFASETSSEGDLDRFEGPGTLLRLGLTERLELRIGWSGYLEEELDLRSPDAGPGAASERLDGSGDGELGAKLLVWNEEGARPQVALLGAVSVPIGDDGLSSERYDPTLLLALDRTLTERLSLGVNVGPRWETEEIAPDRRDTVSDLIYSAALGIGLSERLGAFAEVFGAAPLESGPAGARGSAVSANGGFAWLLRSNLQLDLYGGGGLTDEADDWFVGAGLSVRWPR